ncbi:UNVERIFIED_ORG: deoxyadenosine/deoxycytidine kinase [Ensifer adhaerens]|nr:deoxyadenosine/deoxycytidine kinase [Ensifer adhaerens]
MIVWVSGTTGSGKTTLSNLFASLGWSIVREQLPTQAFSDFAAAPHKCCEPLQRAIIGSRLEQFKKLTSGNIVFDRSASEDVAVFCQMHYERGYLDLPAYDRLRHLANYAEAQMPTPDLILYLAPSVETLQRRISATHPAVIAENLSRQLALYEEWIGSRQEDVLRVDNTSCGPGALVRLFEGIRNA